MSVDLKRAFQSEDNAVNFLRELGKNLAEAIKEKPDEADRFFLGMTQEVYDLTKTIFRLARFYDREEYKEIPRALLDALKPAIESGHEDAIYFLLFGGEYENDLRGIPLVYRDYDLHDEIFVLIGILIEQGNRDAQYAAAIYLENVLKFNTETPALADLGRKLFDLLERTYRDGKITNKYAQDTLTRISENQCYRWDLGIDAYDALDLDEEGLEAEDFLDL